MIKSTATSHMAAHGCKTVSNLEKFLVVVRLVDFTPALTSKPEGCGL